MPDHAGFETQQLHRLFSAAPRKLYIEFLFLSIYHSHIFLLVSIVIFLRSIEDHFAVSHLEGRMHIVSAGSQSQESVHLVENTGVLGPSR